MANQYVPDQSKDFKESGMKLISDPASDALLKKSKDRKTKSGKTSDT